MKEENKESLKILFLNTISSIFCRLTYLIPVLIIGIFFRWTSWNMFIWLTSFQFLPITLIVISLIYQLKFLKNINKNGYKILFIFLPLVF
ncbi:hypothetical protein [Spiroplasma taiwanense]|uniref:Transmembrane protein n=1 Tax=Spiroplasma taiwanense CT-1 TaxID=1276220 RepID=S5LZS6_9MOLU|nr:hypothetical protein [Spiroplasma taiwanense]AGR41207.1 hypothetical protein STAIW_v1c05850 [Spiroplasma taiwanense CT-1]